MSTGNDNGRNPCEVMLHTKWERRVLHEARQAMLVQRQKEAEYFSEQRLKAWGVTCKAKCTACCRQLALGSIYSGVLIAEALLKRHDTQRIKAIWDQGMEQAKLMSDTNLSITVKDDVGPGFDAADIWWARREMCALLDAETQLCSVYDLRPHSCSAYYVVTEPALCDVVPEQGKRGPLVGAVPFQPMWVTAMELDALFLSRVLETPEARAQLIIVPLGMAVAAGFKLLASAEAFVESMEHREVELFDTTAAQKVAL